MAFGHDTTTDEVLDGIDLAGKTAFITGASGGLGAETARALAARGATVTIAARNVAKAEEVAASIRESTGSSVDVVQLELMDLDSVRACAQGWLASHGPLNLLINSKQVAKGEVVVVNEKFAIKITEILDPKDRLNYLQA